MKYLVLLFLPHLMCGMDSEKGSQKPPAVMQMKEPLISSTTSDVSNETTNDCHVNPKCAIPTCLCCVASIVICSLYGIPLCKP